MSEIATQFIHNVFIGFIALFPVINPLGIAFIVNPFLEGTTRRERKRYVLRIALYTFYLCTITLFSGQWILQLFGLSVPVIRLAGGIMICKIGWDMLSGKDDDQQERADIHVDGGSKSIRDKLFYPITFPITSGAGTISVLFTLSSHSTEMGFKAYMLNNAAIMISVIAMCVLVYIMYLNTNKIIERIGEKNKVIVDKIFAFLIFAVGLSIALDGMMQFIETNSTLLR